MIPYPDFPLVWDNSMRSLFFECPQAFFWEQMLHFKSKVPNVHLHAGKAWAGALEETRRAFYEKKFSAEESIALGLQTLVYLYGDFDAGPFHQNKSVSSLIKAFTYYFQAFPLDKDPAQPYMGKTGPMIEFSFALPLDDSLRHPVTDEPILYTGRADMIATYAGALTIYDDKTTSSLGPKWGEQWDRRAQFTAYTWAARAFGIHVSQVLVRGIALLKNETKHAQHLTFRLDHHIEEWHFQMVRDIRRAIQNWKDRYWDKNLDSGCASFGVCTFKTPCQSPSPISWLTGGNFSRRKWDPLVRTETELEIPHEDIPPQS